MTLKEMILNAPDYQLIRRGVNPAETLRAVYDIALAGGDNVGLKEPAAAMFKRTGAFCAVYGAILNEIAGEIYEDLGLAGGVVPGTLADIEDLSEADALRLANITLAQHEADTIQHEIVQGLKDWSNNIKGNDDGTD